MEREPSVIDARQEQRPTASICKADRATRVDADQVLVFKTSGEGDVKAEEGKSQVAVDDDKALDDKALIARVTAGDRDAYRLLVEKYQQRVFALAFEVLRSKEDAEDVVQESFVKAYLSLPDFRGQSAFYTWLYRIAHNMAIDYRRRLVRKGSHETRVESNEALEQASWGQDVSAQGVQGPLDVMERKEQARHIEHALQEISEDHRAVIVLREIEGMNYGDIARVLGVSKGTVMSRLHYARKRLQSLLKQSLLNGFFSSSESDATPQDSEAQASSPLYQQRGSYGK